MFYSGKVSADSSVTCGSSAGVCMAKLQQADLFMAHLQLYIPGLPISPAGTVPRNTIQSQSQETLFFRDTLFPSLLPAVVGNNNLLMPCIRRINFLLDTESLFLSRRRAGGAKIPPVPFTESTATNLSCFLTLRLDLKKSKGVQTHKVKGTCRGIPFYL